MKTLSPAQILLFLALAGMALAGWFYGLHWKRVASGDLFSSDERIMVRLQDQIEALSRTNAELHEKIRSLTGEEEEILPAGNATTPVTESEMSLELPSRGQKIETH